jgi:hypothetical protein
MITGIGDHLRPEWPITITGMRNVGHARLLIAGDHRHDIVDRHAPEWQVG